jgi:hypothetical protein
MLQWVTRLIESAGYGGIVFLMVLENVFPRFRPRSSCRWRDLQPREGNYRYPASSSRGPWVHCWAPYRSTILADVLVLDGWSGDAPPVSVEHRGEAGVRQQLPGLSAGDLELSCTALINPDPAIGVAPVLAAATLRLR